MKKTEALLQHDQIEPERFALQLAALDLHRNLRMESIFALPMTYPANFWLSVSLSSTKALFAEVIFLQSTDITLNE